MAGFIKYMRSEEAEFLLSYPNANHLFCVMAFRARRTDHPMNGLKAGQCFLGDYSEIGMSEQQYRTAKKQLTKWNLATFKGTNKGTVGTIVNTKVYDINEESGNGLDNRQVTCSQRTGNGQVTTNKECKNGKNENKLDWSATQMNESEIVEIKRLRKKAKADVTQRVVDQLAKQFDLSRSRGFTNDDILNEWSLKGWRSFKDEWMKGKPSAPKPQQTFTQNRPTEDDLKSWLK